MPYSNICCDANLVVRLVTQSRDSFISQLWDRWIDEGREIFAPKLLSYELVNAFHQMGKKDIGSFEQRRTWLQHALEIPVRLDSAPNQHLIAFDLAGRYRLSASYDAHYLAVAFSHDAEFWTGDKRLFNAVQHQINWIRLAE